MGCFGRSTGLGNGYQVAVGVGVVLLGQFGFFHFVFALDVARNVVLIFVGLEVVYKIANILLELLLDLPPNLRLPQRHMPPHVQRFPKIWANIQIQKRSEARQSDYSNV